ncbi:hypothetical protein OESDEN_09961 [Oesophagostomum dentatum]|uniref:Uncharacterized protein n=1 Tax=Oesophagostomum dentatum TaxID=61180 RepID=A0A0B1SZ10_OESDE|nr:hypothetical protein OESDEN_09961 [Oesophagostomum dentatum]
MRQSRWRVQLLAVKVGEYQIRLQTFRDAIAHAACSNICTCVPNNHFRKFLLETAEVPQPFKKEVKRGKDGLVLSSGPGVPASITKQRKRGGDQFSLIHEFKAKPIPAFAKKLRGQDLVDYLNIVQPFFKANVSTLTVEEKRNLIMDKRFLEQIDEGDKASHVSEVDIDGSAIPER